MGSLSRSLSTRLIRLRGLHGKRSFDSRPYGDGVWSVDDAENDGQGICYRAGLGAGGLLWELNRAHYSFA